MDLYSIYVLKDLIFGSARPLLSRIAMFDLYNQTLQVLKPENLVMQTCVCLLIFPHNTLPSILSRDGVPYATAKASSTRYQRAKAALIGLNGAFAGWIQIKPHYQQFTLDRKYVDFP